MAAYWILDVYICIEYIFYIYEKILLAFLSFQRYMEVSANLRDSYEDKDG